MRRIPQLWLFSACVLTIAAGCVGEVTLIGAQCSSQGVFCGTTSLFCQQGTCQQITGPLVPIHECDDNDDCDESRPVCHIIPYIDVRLCLECVGDQHCGGLTPVCAPGGVISQLPKCVGCQTDADCDTFLCSPEYQCIPCTANLASCNGGRVCDETSGVCKELESGNVEGDEE